MFPIKQEVALDSRWFMTAMEVSQSLVWNLKGIDTIQ
jgi:hypothetical protein